MEQGGIDILLVAMVSLFLMGGVIIFLFAVFQKKKNFLVKAQILERKKFDQEIINLQIEIREQTLRNVSWELHDNIGQMLTLAKIQLQSVDDNPTLEEVKKTLSEALREVRALSKSINPEYLKNIGLYDAVDLELKRFNRLNFVKSELKIVGKKCEISSKVEIVLFRILQEFFTNTIKHAKAKNLLVTFEYAEDFLIITAKDDGKGFKISKIPGKGIGISNMQKRGKLIDAEINLFSEIGEGSTLSILYKIKNHG